MNIKDLIEKARDLVDDINYTLWFGSKGSYTAKRNVGDKEIILEPFTLRPYRKGACKYTTNLTFWVCIRKSINDGKFNQEDGDDTEFIQMLVDETTEVIKQFNNSDFVSFTQRPEAISLTYYEPNNNQSVNNQGMMRFSVPTEIYLGDDNNG